MTEAIEIKKNLPGKWTLRVLAEAIGIQPSFLTNVLKGRHDFSADQLYAISEQMGFTVQERKYVLLLLEHERCAHASRKKELKEEIETIRREHQKTERHLSAKTVDLSGDAMAEYYLDPFVQLAHVHLNFPEYAEQPEKLCMLLGISKAHLAITLNVLVRIGYVQVEKGKYRVIGKNKHLPKEAPLCGPHQILMRLKSLDQLQRLTFDDKYSFSATFSGTKETKDQVQEAFISFLKKAEALIRPAESKEVFQMNFDLFPWGM